MAGADAGNKILVLYAGGTIGMEPSASGYRPLPDFAQTLQAEWSAAHGDTVPDFEVLTLPRIIDSADLVPSDWHTLGEALRRHWNDYAGFVLLHGTDTMAYTAAALAFLLQGQDKPVVLTGAQIPLCEPGSDALGNVGHALQAARELRLREVCLSFGGRLLRGNRSRKVHSTAPAAFDSPGWPELGRWQPELRLAPDYAAPATSAAHFLTRPTPHFDDGAVMVMPVYPGVGAQHWLALLEHDRPRALLLHAYGMGNVPQTPAMTAVLTWAEAHHCAVLTISQCPGGGVSPGVYATSAGANTVAGGTMLLEAGFAKLHCLLAIGHTGAALRAELSRNLCGELD